MIGKYNHPVSLHFSVFSQDFPPNIHQIERHYLHIVARGFERKLKDQGNIAAAAEQQYATMDQIATSTNQVSQQAQQLKSLTHRFTVD